MRRWISGEVLFRHPVLPRAALTVDHGDTPSFGEGTKAAAEAARHPHQMSIIQLIVRPVPQSAPPGPKTTGSMAERIVGIQHDVIHTGVTAFNQISVVSTQFVGHEYERYTHRIHFSTAPAGVTFSERSLGKSVEILKLGSWF
ncbi:MAG TPA: hypothetical protein VFD30_11200, partial [Terriglobia bacterium]|nr:hypothetical protein [Terriglobia bacterium]